MTRAVQCLEHTDQSIGKVSASPARSCIAPQEADTGLTTYLHNRPDWPPSSAVSMLESDAELMAVDATFSQFLADQPAAMKHRPQNCGCDRRQTAKTRTRQMRLQRLQPSLVKRRTSTERRFTVAASGRHFHAQNQTGQRASSKQRQARQPARRRTGINEG